MVGQIKKRLENGFVPFVLRLKDGRRFEIPHRDFIALSPKTIVVIDRDELAVSINPLHVGSVEDTLPASGHPSQRPVRADRQWFPPNKKVSFEPPCGSSY